jgi:predicted AlkP superfamily pyrophosphatase or phosphodiesterase
MPTSPPDQWTLIQRARASFYPGRSGDFVVLLKKDVTPIAVTTSFVATHGSPWDYDRRVPILFWRPVRVGTTVEAPADTVDIMPTLAAMIGLTVIPGSIDGECLESVPEVDCPIYVGGFKREGGER